ncbi:MAG TPA: cupredoxin domain-containing protein [Longimicrobiales bacterium]|nr:cupredoxin domain-containing protein [Longimicrobiales bacterium]
MSGADILVILGGVTAIAWVNWYFLVAGRQVSRAAVGTGGLQEIRIRVAGGYDPAHVQVRRGPVRLIFDRQETSGCSEEVVLPDLGIRRYLPAHEETVIEFTPEHAGRYEFTCGMSMLRGSVTVVEDTAS